MHGLQNHFVIVDGRKESYRPDVEEIARICDQRVGIGADQLVVLEPPRAAGADVFMRLYNTDGREVGACGNATRCVAWRMLDERGADQVHVETLAGVLACTRVGEHQVRCDLGPVSADWRSIPLAREHEFGRIDLAGLDGGFALNIGNPHLVFFVPDVDALNLRAIATEIQGNALFPESVNVGVAQRRSDSGLRLRVFERSAGLTMACGTGACAAACAASRSGLIGTQPVTVELPGGDVLVDFTAGDGGATHAIMTGPVAVSFRGEIPGS